MVSFQVKALKGITCEKRCVCVGGGGGQSSYETAL